MSIKLKGSSDGSVSFDAPADTSPSGSDITLTLPTSAGSADQFLKNSGIAGELEYSSMVETSTGIGIGTSSPGEPLHISASDPAIKLEDSDGTNQYSIIKNAAGNSIYDAVNGSGTAGAHIFRAPEGSSNEKMRLDTSGRLLVGTSSSKESLSMIQCVRNTESTLSISLAIRP